MKRTNKSKMCKRPFNCAEARTREVFFFYIHILLQNFQSKAAWIQLEPTKINIANHLWRCCVQLWARAVCQSPCAVIKNRLRCSVVISCKAARRSGPWEERLGIWLLISSSKPDQGCTGHSPANTRQYRRRHSFVTVWYVAISLAPPPAFPSRSPPPPLAASPCGFVHPSVLRHEELFCKIEKKKKISKAAECWELTVHFFMQGARPLHPFF